LVMAANPLIENLDENSSGILNETEASVMRGEMLATRAFLHLDMLRLFGPRFEGNTEVTAIPYSETTQVQVLPLLSFGEVVEKIIADLDEAEQLLANDPVIQQGPLASVDPVESNNLRYRQFRFNYYATKALKARAYLYAGQKTEALAVAKSILN